MPFDLHISIPDQSHAVQIVQQLAAAEHITPEQAATQLLIEGANHHGMKTPVEDLTGMTEAIARVRAEHRTYASFFGSVTGPGAHGSKEAVDRYISEMRNEW
jgi:hypothetical protein